MWQSFWLVDLHGLCHELLQKRPNPSLQWSEVDRSLVHEHWVTDPYWRCRILWRCEKLGAGFQGLVRCWTVFPRHQAHLCKWCSRMFSVIHTWVSKISIKNCINDISIFWMFLEPQGVLFQCFEKRVCWFIKHCCLPITNYQPAIVLEVRGVTSFPKINVEFTESFVLFELRGKMSKQLWGSLESSQSSEVVSPSGTHDCRRGFRASLWETGAFTLHVHGPKGSGRFLGCWALFDLLFGWFSIDVTPQHATNSSDWTVQIQNGHKS